MVTFLKNVFSSALKTNTSLEKGVLTGCLRISKESIFTGLNNFKVHSILDAPSETAFGFTQAEVQQLLDDYELSSHIAEVREWYDGYLFGTADIYNPWSTLMYIDRARAQETPEPSLSGQTQAAMTLFTNTFKRLIRLCIRNSNN